MKRYAYQGAKLKECRLKVELSGKEVAATTGFSPSAYSSWETGRVEVPQAKREALCDTLHTTWHYVTMGDQPRAPDFEGDNYPVTQYDPAPQPLANEFAFQCGQLVAHVDTMARQWRSNPRLLDGLGPAYREKLETIFEAVTL